MLKLKRIMIEYENLIAQNSQFCSLIKEEVNCNSFIFESSDEIYLKNFAYEFAKFLFCTGEQKPCNKCLMCEKMSLLALSDLTIFPKDGKTILTEDIKDLIEKVYLSPMESDKKVFILENFSSATISAQNKLLKILEEPPKDVYIILCVQNASKVLPTILSRCKKTVLKPLCDREIKSVLRNEMGVREEEILSSSSGNLTKALSYSRDEEFLSLYSNTLGCITQMKNSSEVIRFSYKLSQYKGKIVTILELFESFFRDLLMIRLGKEELVRNKNVKNNLKKVLFEYNGDSLDLIIRKIYDIKKQVDFNCNQSLLIDNFLLYILEVKYLCNNK